MATYTKEQLEEMKVAELRALAKEQADDRLSGYSKMTKGDLVAALGAVLGGDAKADPVPSATPKKAGKSVAKGTPPKVRTRPELKAELKIVQQKKQAALVEGNHQAVKAFRHRIRKLKRAIRAASQ